MNRQGYKWNKTIEANGVASTCRSYNDLMQERRIPSRPDILP
ncbi:MAG: hypothetical protein ACLSUN_17680 [Anaerobutyricum soehngenii]